MTDEVELKVKVEETKLQHSLSDRDFERKNHWRSCCFDIDRRAAQFTVKVLLNGSVICFCMYQIAAESDGCKNSLLSWYTGTIAGILGAILQEKVSSNKEEQK